MGSANTLRETLEQQGRVILALMLHDIRSRFGGSALGFLAMAIGWPLANVLLILVINSGLGRVAPYGSSTALWYATGVVPFLAFQYMSRWMMMGIIANRPLLTYPILHVTDILFARALVEVLNSGLVVLIVFLLFFILDIDFEPRDPIQASFGMLAMLLLGLGFGVFNAIIAAAMPLWIQGSILITVVLWLASGVMFVPDTLPGFARDALAYLPTLQGVEWVRSAYYEGYGASELDKKYLIEFGLATLFLGLGSERLLRGKLR